MAMPASTARRAQPCAATAPSETVAIVDYGMGNLRSVTQAVLAAAAQDGGRVRVVLTQDPQEVRNAQRIILPGQGAMGDCMRALHDSGLHEAVLEAAASRPLLGVCVGMQMLLTHSEEGDTPGLDLIEGEVRRFDLAAKTQPDGSRFKVPQMGWNRVWPRSAAQQPRHPMWDGIDDGAWFYFVHSYYARVRDDEHCAAQTDYGGMFTCAVARGNLFATQFHPEKSSDSGIRLYRNFLHWQP